jgi:toxin ParE1/3/4
MARKPLEWSARSRKNIESLRDHIAADNPKAALSVVAEIVRTAEALTEEPLIGHPGRRPGTRELVLRRYPYTLIYRVYAARLVIVAVLHQSRKYA